MRLAIGSIPTDTFAAMILHRKRTSCAAMPGSKSAFVPPHHRLFASPKVSLGRSSKADIHTQCAQKQVVEHEHFAKLERESATNTSACESHNVSSTSPLRVTHTKRINTLTKFIDSNHRGEVSDFASWFWPRSSI